MPEPRHARRVDHHYLTDHAYVDSSRLGARIAIYDYQSPKIDLEDEVRIACGPVQGLRVLDVGSGNGRHGRTLTHAGAHVLATDLSKGMLDSVEGVWARAQSDAEALPVATGSVDRVLAAHMLYHLRHPQRAIEEFARVLNADGRLIVTSNTESHLIEARLLWDELLDNYGLDTANSDLSLMNLELPTDRLLADVQQHFVDVDYHLLSSSIILTEPAALANYAASTTAAITTNELGYDLLPAFGERIREHIECDGEYRLTTQVILITATAKRTSIVSE
ncbi:class I SAM-dependent methyltransferase [Ferrimicrobium sp.]|uniref:class I SAM-dependent methyltransferase n=1 Tax=Ferrimicrobium sp. TaxID=2926050 RepID=UPI0026328B49|nr:class I SAM-dependent methyltransferase [Ferrimicrobium sp.]